LKRPADSQQTELDETLTSITKKYGPVSNKGTHINAPQRISTGSFILDLCTLGGIPQGRQSMIVGEKHAGKTTIACKIIANAQRKYPDSVAVFMDCEKAFDTVWAKKLGVDLERIQVVESQIGEHAVDMADLFVSTEQVSILVIDSLATLLPFAEADSSAEDAHIGLQSRLIGRLCRKITGSMVHERLRGHEPAVLYINQFRTRIGQMYGDNRIAPGGRAVEHFPSLVWRMLNKETVGKDQYDVDVVTHNVHEFAITKNKVNNGPRQGEFKLCRMDDLDSGLHDGDVDDSPTVLAYAKKFGVFTGGGKYWKLEFDGQEYSLESPAKAAVFLNQNRGVYRALSNYLLRAQAQHMGMPRKFLLRFDTTVHEDDPSE
jgi:recombination protein RecA